jgi:4-diphosphocytidyl-2-C-methyl-D-erythritol kinase
MRERRLTPVSAEEVRITARAKVNLVLRIRGKLQSGYHLLQSIVAPISLADQVTVSLDRESREVTCTTDFSVDLETHVEAQIAKQAKWSTLKQSLNSADNLAARAARSFLSRTAFPGGVKVRIKKCIPVGAGLGGGSADAAAVLLGLNHLFGTRLSEGELLQLAAELGSDVPAMLVDDLVFMGGRGEMLAEIEARPGELAGLQALLVQPLAAVDTSTAYQELGMSRILSAEEVEVLLPGSADAERLLAEFHWKFHTRKSCDGSGDNVLTLLPQEGISERPILGPPGVEPSSFCNDFQAVILGKYPELRRVQETLLGEGASSVLMAGSGSAMLGFFGKDFFGRDFFSRDFPGRDFSGGDFFDRSAGLLTTAQKLKEALKANMSEECFVVPVSFLPYVESGQSHG